MNYEKIGFFISERRKELNLTQKELASILHVTDKAVSKWERGLGCPDVSILGELSEALQVGIGEILNGEYNENLKDNEQFILDAVNYSKETTTNKIYKKISIILFSVMFLLCGYMVINGIRQMIKFSNVIENPITEETRKDWLTKKEETISKLELILKKDGYTEQEIEKLTALTNWYKNLTVTTFELLDQEKWNYQQYVSLVEMENRMVQYPRLYMQTVAERSKDNQNITNILKHFSESTLELYFDFNATRDSSINQIPEYSYSSLQIESKVGYFLNYLNIHFEQMDIVLDKIMEAGDLHE